MRPAVPIQGCGCVQQPEFVTDRYTSKAADRIGLETRDLSPAHRQSPAFARARSMTFRNRELEPPGIAPRVFRQRHTPVV